jgi:general secretion pathway protein K
MIKISSSKKSKSVSRQQGTVLIIALLIVAIMTGLVVSFSSKFQLSMTRLEQRLYNSQLQQYWFGIESFASWGLVKDREDDDDNVGKNKAYDHFQEEWATTQVEAPLEGGFASAKLEDAQARFNLNQLLNANPVQKPNNTFEQRYSPEQKRFIRLLQTVPGGVVSTTEAEEITDAVIDWIDQDNNVTGSGGAENGYYLSQSPPYYPANQQFNSVSELRLVKGITDEIYEWLERLVIALPDPQAGINIHTADPVILRVLNEGTIQTPISESEVETLISNRPPPKENTIENQDDLLAANGPVNTEGFKEKDDFFNSSEFQSVFGTDQALWPPEKGLNVGTNYFILISDVEIGELNRTVYSLLERVEKNGQWQTQVVKRASEPVF